ncbi:MAG: hypothetical protein N3A65_07375 [candidate division WOR-3 bacterium]|nr:hypothetical protein [candidate division WOR-3 bacterium]
MVILFILITTPNSEPDTLYKLDSVYYNFRPVEIDTGLLEEKLYTPVISAESRMDSGWLTISGIKDFSFDIEEGFNQGLKLHVGGELEGVRIKGALSDEGTDMPTRRLSDIEKIRLELWTKNFYGGIGDLNLALPFEINNEISGVRVGLAHKDNNINFSYALNQGQYRRVEFDGEEGKQGPYFLTGRIVYNSEKVYLSDLINPPRLLRVGVDYEIDHEQGIINFTNKNIITKNTHIIVEYLEATEDYTNIYQESDAQYMDKGFRFNTIFHRTFDDYNSPLGFQLNQTEIESLKICGDSSRVRHIYADTSSTGNYDYVDGRFVYVGEGNGDYRVSFFYVGENNGEYVYDPQIKGFVYRGPKQGNYTPERLIPLPGDNQFYGIGLRHNSGIEGRFYSSIVDRNRFSLKDDEDNHAIGYELNLAKQMGIFSINSKYINYDPELYQPKGRQDLNYNYEWQTEERLNELFQVNTGVKPLQNLVLELGYGILNRAHKKRSIYFRPFFVYCGYEDVDTIKKYICGLRKKAERFLVYSQYLNQEGEHFTDYGVSYFLHSDKSISISGNYERSVEGKKALNRIDLVTRPVNFSFGIRNFSDTTLLFWNSGFNVYYQGFKINGEIEQSQRYTQRKDDIYLKVQEGKGNYVYDPITRTYIFKENGDYIKQTILLQEFERVVSRRYSLEPSFSAGVFDTRMRLFFLDEKNFYKRNEEFSINVQKDDWQVEMNLQEDITRDERYALEMIGNSKYHFSLNPAYKHLYNYSSINYQKEEWGEFLKEMRIDYETEIDFEIIASPQIKPFAGYKYSRLFSDFFPELMLLSHTPRTGLLTGFPMRKQGRLELTGELLYRVYNAEEIPYLFSANEPAGLTKIMTVNGSIGMGNNTILSLLYRILLPPEETAIHNFKFQARIKF